MKNVLARTLLFSLLVFTLSSCGTDMRDWPYNDLSFDVDEIETLYIDFSDKNNSNESQYKTDDTEAITRMYDMIENLHCSSQLTSKDLTEYNRKVCFYFVASDFVYDFKSYEFGLTNYLVNKDEIREFPADFIDTFLSVLSDYSEKYTEIINLKE